MRTETHRAPRLLALALCAIMASCASIRPIGEVIGIADAAETEEVVEASLEAAVSPPTREELDALAATRLEALDRSCRTLVEAADADDASFEQLMAASRALIFTADLRIQRDLAMRFDREAPPAVEVLIDAEDDVPGDLKADVRSLAKSSRDYARRALSLRPEDPGARLFSTLGQGLFLWSLGPLQALANGAGSLPGDIRRLAKDHPDFEGASPLRLKGRLETRAPWPFKNRKAGATTLEAAVEAAPIPLNLLFFGDALWLTDRRDEAIATWERATSASADEETSLAAPLLREIARLRLTAADQAKAAN